MLMISQAICLQDAWQGAGLAVPAGVLTERRMSALHEALTRCARPGERRRQRHAERLRHGGEQPEDARQAIPAPDLRHHQVAPEQQERQDPPAGGRPHRAHRRRHEGARPRADSVYVHTMRRSHCALGLQRHFHEMRLRGLGVRGTCMKVHFLTESSCTSVCALPGCVPICTSRCYPNMSAQLTHARWLI